MAAAGRIGLGRRRTEVERICPVAEWLRFLAVLDEVAWDCGAGVVFVLGALVFCVCVVSGVSFLSGAKPGIMSVWIEVELVITRSVGRATVAAWT